MVSLRIPVATYRLQLSSQCRFEDARALVPYLHNLGISDLYTSPIVKARKGSSHGYDVTDPSCLNPELGTEEDFETLVQTLKHYGMGLLLDIVPNHMAASLENPWWADVLENGRVSPYASFFDIDWNPIGGALRNKVLLPILDTPYKEALKGGELALALEDTGLFVHYRDFKLPVNLKSYRLVISHRLGNLEARLGASHPVFQQLKRLTGAMNRLPSPISQDAPKASQEYGERQAMKATLLQVVNASAEVKAFLMENIALFNREGGKSKTLNLLHKLLTQQAYELDFWEAGHGQINYRRFFDISDLIGVRVEDLRVFEATHALILRLAREGKVTGLRIDHIDGLYDPLEYLSRLQRYLVPTVEEKTGKLPIFYVVAEKILARDEALKRKWPVFGTTGYDFVNTVNALFVDRKGVESLDEIYSRFIRSRARFNDVAYEKKKQVMEQLFGGEMNRLGLVLASLARQSRRAADFSPEELTKAIIEFTACLPIYRTYTRTLRVSSKDRNYLEQAIREARRRNPSLNSAAPEFLKQVTLLELPITFTHQQKKTWLSFVLQWQQLTGAVMAKGFEDTALYTYTRLLSLNEVGADPASSGLSVAGFHRRNLARWAHWPYTLNATSTHDTKRSEDVRARINVLSELPETWAEYIARWSRLNRAKKRTVRRQPVPDRNMEWHIYQTLVGAWPLSQDKVPEFKERLKAYIVKAAREAKVFTNWLSPDQGYEKALLDFVEAILEDSEENEFIRDFLHFQGQIAHYGSLNALAQVLLKTTSPGVPDFYQGTELWDFSLVDPDNRRPVDFEKRVRLLDELMHWEEQNLSSLVPETLTSWQDGRLKLYVTYKTLKVRRDYRDLFLEGRYIPLPARGRRREHICAFARRLGQAWVVTAVPRLLTRLIDANTLPLGPAVWQDDLLLFPKDAPAYWLNVLTGETLKVPDAARVLPLADIFRTFPVALLTGLNSGGTMRRML